MDDFREEIPYNAVGGAVQSVGLQSEMTYMWSMARSVKDSFETQSIVIVSQAPSQI